MNRRGNVTVDQPKTVAKTEPKVDNKEVEAAYRQGLQQFARGDTQGALASLRTSLAGNPNFAPTWRPFLLLYGLLADLSSGSGEELTRPAQYAPLGSLAPGGRVSK